MTNRPKGDLTLEEVDRFLTLLKRMRHVNGEERCCVVPTPSEAHASVAGFVWVAPVHSILESLAHFEPGARVAVSVKGYTLHSFGVGFTIESDSSQVRFVAGTESEGEFRGSFSVHPFPPARGHGLPQLKSCKVAVDAATVETCVLKCSFDISHDGRSVRRDVCQLVALVRP